MSCYRVVKWFRDYADDIEAVNIHYVLTPPGQTPDWNKMRVTRYMPLVGEMVRMKELRLPFSILDTSGRPCNRYTLHYYFEICQSGDRHYSPLYSEQVMPEPQRNSARSSDGGDEVEGH